MLGHYLSIFFNAKCNYLKIALKYRTWANILTTFHHCWHGLTQWAQRNVSLVHSERKEALSDAQWWHPTGLQYQPSAGGWYQRGDAPPTTGDPLITSHTSWTGLRQNTLALHKSSFTHTIQTCTRLTDCELSNTNCSKLSVWAGTYSQWYCTRPHLELYKGKLWRSRVGEFTACRSQVCVCQ